MDLDCYFYIDCHIPEENRKISSYCVDCYNLNKILDENGNKAGWFWKGSENGYSNFNFLCSVCGKVIHQKEELNEN